MILGKSNLEDQIIFNEISMGGKYFIMVNMEGNRNLPASLLNHNRKRGDREYHESIPLEDDKYRPYLEAKTHNSNVQARRRRFWYVYTCFKL